MAKATTAWWPPAAARPGTMPLASSTPGHLENQSLFKKLMAMVSWTVSSCGGWRRWQLDLAANESLVKIRILSDPDGCEAMEEESTGLHCSLHGALVGVSKKPCEKGRGCCLGPRSLSSLKLS